MAGTHHLLHFQLDFVDGLRISRYAENSMALYACSKLPSIASGSRQVRRQASYSVPVGSLKAARTATKHNSQLWTALPRSRTEFMTNPGNVPMRKASPGLYIDKQIVKYFFHACPRECIIQVHQYLVEADIIRKMEHT